MRISTAATLFSDWSSLLDRRGAYYVYDGDGIGNFSLFATGSAPFGGDGGWINGNGTGELDFVLTGRQFGLLGIYFYRGFEDTE